MNLQDILSQVPLIKKERDYWFIRTEGGEYFDSFINNKFIGIGWNNILLEDLVKKPMADVKEKIARIDGVDLGTTAGKTHTSGVYNKLMRFNDLRTGDVVVIPSAFSNRWAFGVINDKRPYIDNNKTGNCEYKKRRKVTWQKVENFRLLDPIFNEIKTNQHSLSNINRYSRYIDIVTNSLYVKGDDAHLVLNVRTTEEINAKEFFRLGTALINVLEIIQNECGFLDEEKVDATSLKLYLQSPGKVELKSLSKKSLIALGLVLAPMLINSPNHSVSSPISDDILNSIRTKAQSDLNYIQDTLHNIRTQSMDDIDKIFH